MSEYALKKSILQQTVVLYTTSAPIQILYWLVY